MDNKKKLIAYEALDKAGKSTQVKRTKKELEEKGLKCAIIHFPNENTTFGKLVNKYLKGEIKGNPYFIATLYANERFMFKDKLNKLLLNNDIVLCDRYMYSALAFQGSQFNTKKEREKFMKWLIEYEVEQNKIPMPDLTFYLDLELDFIAKRLKNSKNNDIHEKIDFLKKVKEGYDFLLDLDSDMITINCNDNNLELDIEIINNKIIKCLEFKNII